MLPGGVTKVGTASSRRSCGGSHKPLLGCVRRVMCQQGRARWHARWPQCFFMKPPHFTVIGERRAGRARLPQAALKGAAVSPCPCALSWKYGARAGSRPAMRPGRGGRRAWVSWHGPYGGPLENQCTTPTAMAHDMRGVHSQATAGMRIPDWQGHSL